MGEKTYLMVHRDGSRRKITVPDDWKVTFGPAAAGNHSGRNPINRLEMPMALRFYESDTKQRAIFTDVVSFRDMSIKLEEERVDVQEKEGFMECDGVRKRTTFRAQTKEWVDPDAVVERPALPSDAEIFGEE